MVKTKTDEEAAPEVVNREMFQAKLDELRVREKAHTHEGDAIAAARRRLPMVEVDASTPLIGKDGQLPLLDTFEGRRLLISYSFDVAFGPTGGGQCEGILGDVASARTLLSSSC